MLGREVGCDFGAAVERCQGTLSAELEGSPMVALSSVNLR